MSAKRKKVSPQAAVKTFSGGIGFALLGIAVITYVIFSLRMASVESEAGAGADRFPLLSAALIILPIGMAAAFSAARVKQLWYIKPFMGLTAVAFSLVICFISVMLRMFGEHDPMWIIESLAELAAISGCAAAVLSLILGDFGAKVAPGVGSFASGACIVGPVLVVVRTIISFSAVISSAGESLDFEKAAELQDELSWTLVSVEATSALASKMFYARLAERIALAALLLCCAAVFARFSSFFKKYNKQIAFADDYPDQFIEEPVKPPKQKKPRKIDEHRSALPSKGSNQVIDPNQLYYAKQKHAASYDDVDLSEFSQPKKNEAPRREKPVPHRTAVRVSVKPAQSTSRVRTAQRPQTKPRPRPTPPEDLSDPSLWNNFSE